MKKFKTVFAFDVIDEVAKGTEVFLIDRCAEEIECVNDSSLSEIVSALKGDNNDNRFEFYKVVED